jgi:hypothetical protein
MARPVSEALVAAMRAHGVPEAILTANGKVLTAGFGSNLVASRAFSEVLAGSVLRWQNRSLDAAAAVAELV